MGEAPGRGGPSRREAAAAFCSALWTYPDGTPRDDLAGLYATIFVSGINRCEWQPVDQPDRLADRLVTLDAENATTGGNVYVGATLTGARDTLPREDGRPRARPHAEDARALIGLWADIDIAELGGHGTKSYPRTEDEARRLLDRLPLRPSIVLHTGGGWQAWWLLSEPWVFGERFGEVDSENPDAQEADRAAAAELSRDWCHTLQAHAEDAGGWTIDSTFDLARLLRPAGTSNRKGHDEGRAPRSVVLIDELSHGPRYEVDDLSEALLDPAVLKQYRMPTIGPDDLGGVDLLRIWARVTSIGMRERRWTPGWVEFANEAVDTSPLALAWDEGKHGGYADDDPSSVDARITRWLFDHDYTTEQACEALMCLHLRTGHKVDKIDPTKRTDYLVRTVGRFRETSRQATEAKASRDYSDATAHAAGMRGGSTSSGVAPAPPDPVPARPAAAQSSGDAVPSNGTDETVTAPQRDDQTPTARDPERADDGSAETTHSTNEPDGVEDTANGHTGETEPDPGHDALAQHVVDRVRHPVDEVRGDPRGDPGEAPRATPPPEGEPSLTDPWGKRDEVEAQLCGDLSTLLINHVYEGIEVWRLEVRNFGIKQEARLILSVPAAFTWPGGDRPALYHPGRPLATSWIPREHFTTHKGFHTALINDAKITPREVAPKGQQPQPHQADAGTWRALITALVPYWRRDSSRTDLASAAHDWLFQLLTERPAVKDINDAASSGRPWLADHNGYRADPPPRIYVSRGMLLDFITAQPGAPGPGPAAGSVLELLRLTDRRVRRVGPGARRMRWLEIDADQFDAETWATIVEDTAEAVLQRERITQQRHGLRLVPDGETPSTAAETLQARLTGDDASTEAPTLGDAVGEASTGRSGRRADNTYEGESF